MSKAETGTDDTGGGTPLTTVRNVGPAQAAALERAGIATAETLREIGADEAYLRMVKAGTRPHFIGYYSLCMGLQGRPWNDCKGAEKEALRARFDALVSRAEAAPGEAGIERILDLIGTGARRR